MDTTCKVKFGWAATKEAIDQAARDLEKEFSKLKVPHDLMKQIIIVPHLHNTWRILNHFQNERKTIRHKKHVWRVNTSVEEVGEYIEETV